MKHMILQDRGISFHPMSRPIGRKPMAWNYRIWLPVFVLSVFFSLCATARSQQVQAALSQEFSSVGQPVQLNISVVGGRGAQVPQDLKIDGLEARFAGKSEQMQVQMNNGRFSSTVTATYTYLIIPLRQGNFTIPPISVNLDGRTLKTTPLSLRVGGSSGGVPVLPAIPVQPGQQSAPPSAPAIQTVPPARQGPLPDDKIAFGDLIIPKKTAYAGEVIPVEIRFYFEATHPVRLQDRPSFTGDGFTVLRFSKAEEKQQEIDGRIYNVVSFQTAITPAKSGELEIPAATIDTQIQMPSRRSRPADDFFGGLFGNMGESREVTVATKALKLEVKPLPQEGRPEEFSGAIGQFSIQAAATPRKAAAGDPISLQVTVSGRGNFEAMSAPNLIESEGWRTYPPSENFVPSASDPIGFNGEKKYEYMLLAREDQSRTPVAGFSFFDPAIEKFVTLKSSAIPVEAKGGSPAPAQSAVVAAAPTPAPQPQAAPTVEPAAGGDDSLVSTFLPSTFQPFVFSRKFLVANGVLAAAWCAALLFGVARLAATSARARESAARREVRKLLHKMDDPDVEPAKFFDLGVGFVHARLASKGSAADTRDLLESSGLSDGTKAALRQLLDQHDALKYSTSGTGLKPGPDERRQIINQLKSFDEELH